MLMPCCINCKRCVALVKQDAPILFCKERSRHVGVKSSCAEHAWATDARIDKRMIDFGVDDA
jgi:hypothetical protein